MPYASPAGLIRPLGFEPPARPIAPAAESSVEFGSYFERARAATRASRPSADRPEHSDEAPEPREPESQEKPDAAPESAAAARAPATPVIPIVFTSAPVEAVEQTATPAPGFVPAAPTTPNAAKPTAPQGPAIPASGIPPVPAPTAPVAPEIVEAARPPTDPVVATDSPRRAQPIPAASAAEEPTQVRAPQSPRSIETSVSVATGDGEEPTPEAAPRDVPVRRAAPTRKHDEQNAGARERNEAPAVKLPLRADTTAIDAGSIKDVETTFDRKVKAARQSAREAASTPSESGATSARPPVAAAGRASQAISSARSAATAGLTALTSDDSIRLTPRIREVAGDTAASAVGRFLVEGLRGGTESAHAGSAAPARMNGTSVPQSGTSPPVVGTTAGAAGTAAFGEVAHASSTDPTGLGAAARVMSASVDGGRWNLTMQLDPPELGQLRVQIRMEQAGMTLRVDAESANVSRLIESRFAELREALAAHGIRVDRMEAQVRSEMNGHQAGGRGGDGGSTADGHGRSAHHGGLGEHGGRASGGWSDGGSGGREFADGGQGGFDGQRGATGHGWREQADRAAITANTVSTAELSVDLMA